MKDKKRNTDEYTTFQVYPEIKYVKGLDNESLLTLGMVYNFTGKNKTSFVLGKNVNGVTKAFNMNRHIFNVRKFTRNDVRHILDSLIDTGWLTKGTSYIEKQEFNGKVTTKELTPVNISDMGMIKIKEGIRSMYTQNQPTSLF